MRDSRKKKGEMESWRGEYFLKFEMANGLLLVKLYLHIVGLVQYPKWATIQQNNPNLWKI